MDEAQGAALGALVQSYVRAKAQRSPSAAQAAERLGPEVRSRVDMLGVDDEVLLRVPPEQVMARLSALEAEAALEDSGVSAPRRRSGRSAN